MASDSFISIRNVDKFFGTFQAVRDVSIEIRQGEFFSLLGASGCGKTTLLRMLAGFELESSGEISIDGQSMRGVPPHHRPVNMVFQSYAIFPHLNVRANIAYGLRKMRLSRTRKNEMVDEMLDLIKMPGYGHRRSHELSGGQRQRIALARALILRPKVLLLDEPLGALDKQLREQMQLELRALQRTVQITFVFVTHDQEEALTLSDRIAVMSGGRVLQIDTPSGLYERPRTGEVANFIGNMNFFRAEVRVNGAALADVNAEGLGRLKLPADMFANASGSRIQLAIRPEKLRMSDHPPANCQQSIQGRLASASYLGDRSHYFIELKGAAAPISVSAQNAERADRGNVRIGETVWLSWADDAVVVLED